MDNKVQMSEHSDTDCPHYLGTVYRKNDWLRHLLHSKERAKIKINIVITHFKASNR